MGEVLFNLKWAIEVTPPFKNCSRRQISACNVSTVRASEVQLWRIRSRTRAFKRAIDEVRTLRAASMMGDCLHWQPTTAVIIVQLFWFIYFVNKLSLSLSLSLLPLSLPKGGSKSELFPFFLNKSQLQLNEVCNKVSLRENFQRQSCSTLIPCRTVHRCRGKH